MSVMKKRKTEGANKNERAEEEVEEIRSDPDDECYTSCCGCFVVAVAIQCVCSIRRQCTAASRGLGTQMNLLMFRMSSHTDNVIPLGFAYMRQAVLATPFCTVTVLHDNFPCVHVFVWFAFSLNISTVILLVYKLLMHVHQRDITEWLGAVSCPVVFV